MMKIIILFLALMTNLITGQKLPNLNLSESQNSRQEIKSPLNLNKGEICVTLVEGGGMSGFDYHTHYIYIPTMEKYKLLKKKFLKRI